MRCRAIGTWQSAGINCSACEGTRNQRWLVGCSVCGQQKGKGRSMRSMKDAIHALMIRSVARWRFIQMFSTQNIETWKVSLSRYSHKMSQTLRERRYVSRKSRICFGGVHQIHLGMCQVDQPLPSGPSVYLFGGGLMARSYWASSTENLQESVIYRDDHKQGGTIPTLKTIINHPFCFFIRLGPLPKVFFYRWHRYIPHQWSNDNGNHLRKDGLSWLSISP